MLAAALPVVRKVVDAITDTAKLSRPAKKAARLFTEHMLSNWGAARKSIQFTFDRT